MPGTKKGDVALIRKLRDARDQLKKEIGRVIVGQEKTINDVLTALLARGHCLIVGVPGLAKTLLVRTLAEILDLGFNRIQFTPDLMPSDITGTDILHEEGGRRLFRFARGPVFANIVLADEINRTPPKTQSALLQAMQEYRVSAGGNTYELDLPFFVLATQNPIEQEGTYPLPEAQLDRFMFAIHMDYPERDEEVKIVKWTTAGPPAKLSKVLRKKEILKLQETVRKVPVAEDVVRSAVDLVRKTRPSADGGVAYVRRWVQWGAGPRASQYLVLAAKVVAALDGRFAATREDVRQAAMAVLRHRIVTNFHAEADGVGPQDIVSRLLDGKKK